MEKFTSIDQYIGSFPEDVQLKLIHFRKILKIAIPEAQEVISYNMPAIKTSKVLVYYAAYKKHIGFYPCAEPIVHYKDQLSDYKTSKGAIQFPHNKELPEKLISEIINYRKDTVDKGN